MENNFQNKENFDLKDKESYNINKNTGKIGTGQKVAALGLAVFAFLIILFWAAQFKKSIMEPLNGNDAPENSAIEQNNSDLALKTKDTDNDGLSDYDELNIFKTSPFLEDSDSDGIKDKDEIDKGADPNCPAGTDCYGKNAPPVADENAVPQNKDNNPLSNILPLNNDSTGGGSAPTKPGAGGNVDIEALLGKKLDAATLRQMLLQAGMKQEVLDKISDEDLMKSYQEVANKK